MKYSLKQKLLLFVASFGLLLSFTAPVAALVAPTTTFAVGAVKCGSNETAIKSAGDSVAHSCCPNTVQNKNATSCLFAKYVNPVVNLLSAIVGVVVVIGIIVGAIQFSSSAGDPQKAANGKNHIRNALFGLAAYILLYAFLQFIIPGGFLNG
ncbi:MAG: hypothetical protein ABIR37_02720 [Candidatus Saccharimonadales bacterium]